MAKYLITEKAGRFVAGHRNTGVGTVLDLLPFAAEYELRLGTLVPADLPPQQVEAAELPDAEGKLPDTEARLPDTKAGWPDPTKRDELQPAPKPIEAAEAPAAAVGKRKRRT